jgi:GT2 family glycosyltransferase
MTGFAFDLAKLCAYEGVTRCAKGGSLMIYQVPGTLIFNQRERLAEEALKDGADAILWVDSDMRFPKDALEILLSRDLPIVGVNATTRRFPVKPTALDIDPETNDLVKVDSKGKTGLEQVMGVGFGMVLIKKEVFEAAQKPWFWFEQTDKGGIIGEDIYFCAKAFDAGYKTVIDHDLSMHIRHIGTYEYGWDDA